MKKTIYLFICKTAKDLSLAEQLTDIVGGELVKFGDNSYFLVGNDEVERRFSVIKTEADKSEQTVAA